MPSADRRAKLLSGLMGAKGAPESGGPETPPPAAEPAAAAEPDRATSAIARIAARRAAAAPSAPAEAPAPAAKPDTGEGVLYSKGAATASTFKPWYWSYDHKDEGGPDGSDTVVTRIPAPSAPASEPPPAAEPPRPLTPAARAEDPVPVRPDMLDEDEAKHQRGLSRIVVLLAAGCVTLLVAGGGFVYWQSQSRDGAPMTAQAERPAQQLPAPPVAAAPAAPAPEATPATPAAPKPAAPATALKPAPAPVPPVPPASDAQPKPAETAAAPASPPPAAESKPAAPAQPAPAPAAPTASTQELAQLIARGDELIGTGDIAAARLFYERAAEGGSALAMTAVGQTYDPIYLEQLRVRGVRGDAKRAADWYRKATTAGDPQAEVRLKRLLARTGG